MHPVPASHPRWVRCRNGPRPEQCRVITPDVGGGFGGKNANYVEDFVVGAAARAIGRPVRWVETRSESMTNLPTAAASTTESRSEAPATVILPGLPGGTSCRTPVPTRRSARYFRCSVGSWRAATTPSTASTPRVSRSSPTRHPSAPIGEPVAPRPRSRSNDHRRLRRRDRHGPGRAAPQELPRQGRLPVRHPDRRRYGHGRLRGSARQGARGRRCRCPSGGASRPDRRSNEATAGDRLGGVCGDHQPPECLGIRQL